jgi:hypothetical protein
VRAGKDPITGRSIKLTETCATKDPARSAQARMLVQLDAENHPARSATVEVLMNAWMDIYDRRSLATSE